jgi:3-deoxy-D-manno-octulosonic-acid transferase
LAPAVKGLSAVLAQTEDDAQRLRAFGAPSVQVCGNLKFDVVPAPILLAQGRAWRDPSPGQAARPVVLAASTREGEEGPLLQAWLTLPAPRPLLLLVPRHPQRFDEVAAQVGQAGLSLWRRSSLGAAAAVPAPAQEADVWLGDSMGEMPMYYAASHVALLGGSFAPLGGQNLIEAAACGCPIVLGPHTFNFAQAAEQALAAGAAWRVADIQEGVKLASEKAIEACQQALDQTHTSSAHPAAVRALQFAQAHRGAAMRQAEAILGLIERQGRREAVGGGGGEGRAIRA